MSFLKSLNLAVRFLLELCALLSLGYWGFHFGRGTFLKFALGIGSPLLIAIVWGAFIAPKASFILPEPYRFILELIIFGTASSALFFVGKSNLAIVLGLIFLVNRVLLVLWKQ